MNPWQDLLLKVGDQKFQTILADPPWEFHDPIAFTRQRMKLPYPTLSLVELCSMPISHLADKRSHLYLWVPLSHIENALVLIKNWGFTYKTLLVWHKTRKDGGSDGRCVGYYFRNVAEICLFGVRGKYPQTLKPARKQVNLISEMKREHSRKPEKMYDVIESCSPGPYLELFARHKRQGWMSWGNEI